MNNGEDERLALAHRVAGSGAFRKSPRLRAFLLFVVERSVAGQGNEIIESEIGCQVFGRKPGFDSAEDSIVRTAARQLRVKVKEYFETEGRDEKWTLEIPKGGYAPIFLKKPETIPDSVVRGLYWRQALLAAVIVLPLCAAAWLARDNYLLRMGLTPPDPPSLMSHLIWATPEQTKVVLADFGFMLSQVDARKRYSLRDYLEYSYHASDDERRIWTILRRNPTAGIGAIEVAGTALRAAGSRSAKVHLRHARNMQARDFRTGELFILIGSAFSNPWFHLYEDRLAFQVGSAGTFSDEEFINQSPLPGEQRLYGSEGSHSHALLALISNHLGAGRVLLISGLTMAAVEAAGEFASSPKGAEEVTRLAGIGKMADLPDFELLLSTTAADAAVPQSRVVAFRRK